MEKTLQIHLEANKTRAYAYKKTDLHCPSCSEQEVWMDTDDGDIYIGSEFICTSCNSKFYMPVLIKASTDSQTQQISSQLKGVEERTPKKPMNPFS